MENKGNILIIDDDPDIVESMKAVLENKKYKVSTASAGEEGLKRAKVLKPDLIILDVMMETSDKGFDVARKMKSDKNLKNIPIIMLTAVKESTGFDFKKEAGDEAWLPVDDYCDKPLNADELVLKVENFLKKK